MDRQDYVIEVSHVSKSFKDNKVLKDVSLLCESGKIYGLVGHNGSGKTVLFKSICGFLSCDEGTITVNGKVMGKDKDMLTDAGIIIEDPGFLRTWSGYHNLEFLLDSRNKLHPDERNPESYEEAVGQMTDELIGRLEWLDENIEVLKQYCHESAVKKFNH